ncbi:MAG: VCBS repeat-containing protein, partial [Sphingomonadales bacterium]
TVDGFGLVTVDAGIGNDRVVMSNRFTTVTLGAGADTFGMRFYAQTSPLDQRAILTDWQAGVDVLQLNLSEWAPGYTSGNPFALGYMWLLQDGADVVLRRDFNGGGDSYYEMIRFQNISLSAFTAADFQGFNPFVAPMIAPMQGTANQDLLQGSTLDNVINALGGDDFIRGYAGNDTINGGEGYDIAVFSGQRSQYVITNLSDGSTRVAGPDGTDTLTNIERIRFFDGGDYVRGTATYSAPTLAVASFGSSAAAGGWADNRTTPRVMADVNGDGRADIVGFGSAGTYVSLGTSNGGFGAIFLAVNSFGSSAAGGGWSSDAVYPRTMADVNGDGREDIIGFGGAGTYVSLANANGSFGAIYLAAATFGSDAAAGGWTNSNTYPRTLADINGDGRADLVGFGGAGVYAALGNGNGGFGAVYLALNSFGASAAGGGWSSNDIY